MKIDRGRSDMEIAHMGHVVSNHPTTLGTQRYVCDTCAERDEAVALLRRAREQAIEDIGGREHTYECAICGSYWPTEAKPDEYHFEDCVIGAIDAHLEGRDEVDAQRQAAD